MKNTIFDLETTGIDTKLDRIVEIAIVETDSKLNVINKVSYRINPEGIKMNPIASEITGIKDSDLVNERIFPVIWELIKQYFDKDHNLITYNGNAFDIKLLANECIRHGLSLDVKNKKIIDVFLIEKSFKHLKLVDVFKNYTGKTMEEAGLTAHAALADTLATLDVFKYQIKLHKDEVTTFLNERTELSSPLNSLERKGNSYFIKFGKYKGLALDDIYKNDPSYFNWLLTAYCEKSGDVEFKNILLKIKK